MGWVLVILAFFFFLYNLLYQSTTKRNKSAGNAGERIVSNILSNLDGRLLDNVLLSIGNSVTQIDHIFITSHTVFVIETKHYGGTVRGDNERYWSVTYSNGSVYSFYSPVKQNKTHVDAVMACLRGKNVKVESVVVFSKKDCDLIISCDEARVMNVNYFEKFMMEQSKLKKKTIDREGVYSTLKSRDLSSNREALAMHKSLVEKHSK